MLNILWLDRQRREALSVYWAKMMKIDVADERGQTAEDSTTICPHAIERLQGGIMDWKGRGMEVR